MLYPPGEEFCLFSSSCGFLDNARLRSDSLWFENGVESETPPNLISLQIHSFVSSFRLHLFLIGSYYKLNVFHGVAFYKSHHVHQNKKLVGETDDDESYLVAL